MAARRRSTVTRARSRAWPRARRRGLLARGAARRSGRRVQSWARTVRRERTVPKAVLRGRRPAQLHARKASPWAPTGEPQERRRARSDARRAWRSERSGAKRALRSERSDARTAWRWERWDARQARRSARSGERWASKERLPNHRRASTGRDRPRSCLRPSVRRDGPRHPCRLLPVLMDDRPPLRRRPAGRAPAPAQMRRVRGGRLQGPSCWCGRGGHERESCLVSWNTDLSGAARQGVSLGIPSS